ncbi:hypothetical protein SAMN02745164_00343 [Marinitoga hydrogenitolerans DSM 16785]|uniref:Rho termination factor N-terminal domain-containing protein n=1 Tax=Marinitoga hydrogenitolerans (strain DSM 16785 / JCM 12826 / AT1271) TaxID=1122195 RepID=A0A1M4T237_MARH1|nr:DUF4912 domain-containing protein [Marinitoga hydrogenitolerans]SHE38521.1 hypothetical protein SAMN02745164_00343 [Marinitoga hydrogenitolerans DSM 16785]
MIIDKKLSRLLESEEPSIQELRNIAKNMGIKLKRSMRKKDIIKVIKNKLLQLKEEGLITDTSNQLSFQIPQISGIDLIKNNKELLNEDMLIITSVNSNWIFAFWNFSKELMMKISKIPENTKMIMRFYDVTNKDFAIDEANRIYESINDLKEYKSYYFFVPVSNAEYIAEIGYLNKEFIPLIRSNRLKMPSENINISENVILYNLKSNKKKKLRKKINVNIVEKIPSVANGNMTLPQLGDRPPISGGGSFVWNLYSLNRGIKK